MTQGLAAKDFIQIETTTRCLLGCPACSRTVFAETLHRPYPKIDLDVDALWNFLDCNSGRAIPILSLCGDYGDSIYYPRLFELIERFRSEKTFIIHTAGSHQPKEFWLKLVALLTPADTVVFGIDGLEDTNHIYRRNSNWASIMTALDTCVAAGVQVKWDTNIFSFNYDRLDEIRQFAENRGAEFVCKKTSRFGDESLRPPGEQLIDTDALYQDHYDRSAVELAPQCQSQRVISATGHLRPCGWITAPFTFYRSRLKAEQDLWTIHGQTLDDVVVVLNRWTEEIRSNPAAADVICRMKCKPGQVPTVYYE